MSQKKLDLLGGISVVVGSILGSGIFIAPALIASFSNSFALAMLFWILGGMMCAIGAGIYGRLGLMFPSSGGQYYYLKHSLGPEYSRYYGWMSLAVICPTMLASISLFFGEQWKLFFPVTPVQCKGIAIGIVVLFTFLNTKGISLAGVVQKFLVLLHMVLFMAVLVLGWTLLPGAQLPTHGLLPTWSALSLSKGILALSAVLWSFEGFNSVTFITAEIQDGERNVRKIALIGCAIVLVFYLLFNIVVFQNIPGQDLSAQTNAAATLMKMAIGPSAGLLVFSLTILGIATVLHTSVIIGPRITAATATDRMIPQVLGELHPVHASPNKALWLQCFIVTAYICAGHFEGLLTCFIVMNWLFYGMTALGYLKLRNAMPSSGRTRLTSFLDVAATLFFLAMVGLLLLSQAMESPLLAFAGTAVLLVGILGPRVLKWARPGELHEAPVAQVSPRRLTRGFWSASCISAGP